MESELPLDRAPYEALVTAVLAWKDPRLHPRDYEQIALQLTGHARAVAAGVRRHAAALPKHDGRCALAEVDVREAAGRMSAPLGSARCAQKMLFPDFKGSTRLGCGHCIPPRDGEQGPCRFGPAAPAC
ncbi:restriction endonuclease [Streptomyces niveus]|uniref:restriction endonuclease n=1 Tax=Streptomyces niveus TaxID=193462 RepID=UPI00362A0E05